MSNFPPQDYLTLTGFRLDCLRYGSEDAVPLALEVEMAFASYSAAMVRVRGSILSSCHSLFNVTHFLVSCWVVFT